MRDRPAPERLELARQDMVDRQLRSRGITSPGVLAAMGRVPREEFVLAKYRDCAYDDRAMQIRCRQTISQPYMVALMTEALELSGDEFVLEIGTGSGYQTAILAELARGVVSIERHAELSLQAGKVLSELGYENVTLSVGDGTLGCPESAPFDRIIVTAAADEYPPPLFGQLTEGGILVIPIGDEFSQVLEAIHKVRRRPRTKRLVGCRFVPLIGAQGRRS